MVKAKVLEKKQPEQKSTDAAPAAKDESREDEAAPGTMLVREVSSVQEPSFEVPLDIETKDDEESVKELIGENVQANKGKSKFASRPSYCLPAGMVCGIQKTVGTLTQPSF